jgi:hypothetical protein
VANKKPFFITGSNCKIKVNGVTIAYATDLSYSVSIGHIPVKILGIYESDTIEPVSYSVTGSFTVIRYVDGASNYIGKMEGSNGYGNGVGSFADSSQFTRPDLLRSDGKADQSANPAKLGDATGFDIEIYQKIVKKSSDSNLISSLFQAASSPASTLDNVFIADAGSDNLLGIARIRNCRITAINSTISKRSPMIQQFQFIANYVDEDSFIAETSGQGQQFS